MTKIVFFVTIIRVRKGSSSHIKDGLIRLISLMLGLKLNEQDFYVT